MVLTIRLGIILSLIFVVSAACSSPSSNSQSNTPVPLSLGGSGALNSDSEAEGNDPNLGNLPDLGALAGVETSSSRTGTGRDTAPALVAIDNSNAKYLFFGFPNATPVQIRVTEYNALRPIDAVRERAVRPVNNLVDFILALREFQGSSFGRILIPPSSTFESFSTAFYGGGSTRAAGFNTASVAADVRRLLWPAIISRYSTCLLKQTTKESPGYGLSVVRADRSLKNLLADGASRRKIVVDLRNAPRLSQGDASSSQEVNALNAGLYGQLDNPERPVAIVEPHSASQYSARICSCQRSQSGSWGPTQEYQITYRPADRALSVSFLTKGIHRVRLMDNSTQAREIGFRLNALSSLNAASSVDFSRPYNMNMSAWDDSSRDNVIASTVRQQTRLEFSNAELATLASRAYFNSSSSSLEFLRPEERTWNRLGNLRLNRGTQGAWALGSISLMARENNEQLDLQRYFSLSSTFDGTRYINQGYEECLPDHLPQAACARTESQDSLSHRVNAAIEGQDISKYLAPWNEALTPTFEACSPVDCSEADASSQLLWNLDTISGATIHAQCSAGRETILPPSFDGKDSDIGKAHLLVDKLEMQGIARSSSDTLPLE